MPESGAPPGKRPGLRPDRRRLLVPPPAGDLRAGHLPQPLGILHFGIRTARGHRSQAGSAPASGGPAIGGWRFSLQLPGAGHGGRVWTAAGNDCIQRQGLRVLRPQQKARYGRTHAADLVNPDFAALARAFGAAALRVEQLQDLPRNLSEALCQPKPCLIEVTAPIPWPPHRDHRRHVRPGGRVHPMSRNDGRSSRLA